MLAFARATDVPALLARLGACPRRMTTDSRRVEPGVAFAAYRGARADGRMFVADAIARGTNAVLWEAAGFRWDTAWQVPNVAVPELPTRLGAIADFIYGSPSQALWTVGVTGTNGKTSCAHWIGEAFDRSGRRAGIIGTLGNGLVGSLAPSTHTTPDAVALQEILAAFRDEGATAVAMEVSSHGLAQGRVNGVAFDIALFTNLSRDHLDYHETMAAYGAAKAQLFAWPGLHTAVINADDAFGRTLLEDARKRGRRVLSYGLGDADIAATDIALTAGGTALSVTTPWGDGAFLANVAGTFNVLNLLGVLGTLLASDIPLADALAALARLTPPPGRMQRLGGVDRPLVIVDYAHTPDALDQVLQALRPSVATARELVCVFGCGGDRDAGKRPEMGRIAAHLADRLIVTSDNPRGEDPAQIAAAIVRGIDHQRHGRWTVELDRQAAIRTAIQSAREGDVVLIAGKGHETHQDVAGVRVPFSDIDEARDALAQWSGE